MCCCLCRTVGRSIVFPSSDYCTSLFQKSHHPSCLLIRTVSQGMQDILFSSKFVDWPSSGPLITATPQSAQPRRKSSTMIAYRLKAHPLCEILGFLGLRSYEELSDNVIMCDFSRVRGERTNRNEREEKGRRRRDNL